MITKEKIRETLSVFHAGDPMQYVYMHEPYVMKTEYCYTLACFAGWWGYLKYQNEGEFNERGYFQTDNGPFADDICRAPALGLCRSTQRSGGTRMAQQCSPAPRLMAAATT